MSTVRKLVYNVFKHLAAKEMSDLANDCKHPEAAQQRKLKEILRLNGKTAFAKAHGLSPDSSLEQFRKQVPISDYEAHSPYIDRIWQGEKNILSSDEPFMFATTSGTMGKAKYIPVSQSYIKEFRNASVASGFYTLQNFPEISNGVTLSVFSPAQEGLSPAGIPYGAISGGLYKKEPFLVKKYIAPIPYEVYLERNYEAKYYAILRCALVLPIACFYTLNPSTIVVLLKRLDKYAGSLIKDIAEGSFTAPASCSPELLKALRPFLAKNKERAAYLSKLLEANKFTPVHIWPSLKVVCCWTRASAAFYIKDFPAYFGDIPIIDISYGASEGRGTISMGDGRQLLSIRSHFFEFVPEAQIDNKTAETLLAHELKEGENYYILYTTSSGLFRYHINDVIKVVGFHESCPLIEFQYKGGNISSFTGEKLTELQVTDAMRSSLAKTGIACRFFTVLPEFNPVPHYRLLLETEASEFCSGAKLNALLDSFDSELSRLNIEYKAKRESLRLDPLEGALLKKGAYESLRMQMTAGGVADAQIKLSHLNPKPEVRAYFEEQVEQHQNQESPKSGQPLEPLRTNLVE